MSIFPKNKRIVTTRYGVKVYNADTGELFVEIKRPDFTIRDYGFRTWWASKIASFKWWWKSAIKGEKNIVKELRSQPKND